MGVDARILIKITNPAYWLDVKQLRAHSARLADTIGHNHFFIKPKDGQHALEFVRETYLEYLKDYNDELGDNKYKPDGPTVYWQDGDDITAEPHEQFITVNLWSRYYGENYARGDWKILHFVIRWCMYNIPACEVWYGGDSSGIEAELMTPTRLAELDRYYLTKGHNDYFAKSKNQYNCEFCNVGIEKSGGGGDHHFYHCNSCGGHWLLKTPNGMFGPKFVCVFGDKEGDNPYHADMCAFDMSNEVTSGIRKLYPFDGIFRISYKNDVPATI